MNKRQITILWILALVLVGALVITKSMNDEGFQSTTERTRGETLLPDFPAEEVTRITIREGEDQSTLVEKDGGWVVAERDDYPAGTSQINEFLRTLDEVTVTRGIEADPSFAPRFGMDPEAGDDAGRPTVATFSGDGGDELAKLSFGKNLESGAAGDSPFGGGGSTGRFVRNHADDSGVYVTNELFPTLSAAPADWLDEAFLEVEKVRSVAVSEPGRENQTAWKLTRPDESGDFTLESKEDDEDLNPSALNPIKNLFSYARFEDVVPNSEAEDRWQRDQRRTAVIETVEGFTYNVTFGPAKSDGDGEEAPDPASGPAARQQQQQQQQQEPYLMRVVVTADIPDERKVEEDESEEDAASKQEAFDKRRKELEEKLAATDKLQGRTFEVTRNTLNPILKSRSDFLQSGAPAGGARGPGAGGMPGGMTPPNRGTPPARRSGGQAVTPPIAIPPAERRGGGEDAEEEE